MRIRHRVRIRICARLSRCRVVPRKLAALIAGQVELPRLDAERPRDPLDGLQLDGLLAEHAADQVLGRLLEVLEIGDTLGERSLASKAAGRERVVQAGPRGAHAPSPAISSTG